MLMLGTILEMKAADVYLLTAQTINGIVGNYEVPSNHQLAQNTSGSNVYSLKITSMPEKEFWFRIGVSGQDGNKQIQPKGNGDQLTINEEGTQNPTSDSGCYGNSNAWKVSYTADEYEYLTVNVDITEGTTHRVWIEGKKVSAGGSDKPVVLPTTDVEPGYYLVGNFFSQYNKGGEYNPGGDGKTINYTNHVYFKFEPQKDKSYSFSIPACLTAHAQILAVDEYDNKMVYGPGKVFNLHGAKNNTSAWPSTNGTVGTICGTTGAKTLVGSATMAEDNNYWNLVTRNDGETDDDGMYTFSFTLDKDGNPSDWQVKHDANTRVTYFIDNKEGATAQPLYARTGGEGSSSDIVETPLYFDGSNSYWAIGYIVNGLSTSEILTQARKATPDIHATKSVNNNSGTHDKLFFLGNGGVDYNNSSEMYRDKVWANQKPFTLHLHGIKRIQYNPNQGNNDLSMQEGSYGLSGSIQVISGNPADADLLINTMSMIGDAVEGTYDAVTGKWKYTSTAGDMKYDANERCFSLTISTVDAKYAKSHFRFVANRDADQNWGETDDNITNNTGFARSAYDAADDGNHSCMADDPNDVQFRKTAREDEEGFGSTTPNKKDILWNRPAGIWTIRFYPELDKDGKDISRYTISETKVIKMPFRYCVGKFIRTYSNNVAMTPVDDNVKVYEAYRYKKPENAGDPLSQRMGTVYLRQLKYIPANMGVVLVGEVPEGSFSDGDKLDFSLMEAPAEMPLEGDNYTAVWTKADEYAGQEWNNYLKPTVMAIDNLGNADTDADGKILHRFFGLANFHSTNYYKQNGTGDDYIGFFRLTQNGKSDANKAYLSIPANTVVDGGVGAKFGYIDFNGQFLGNETDLNNQSLAKMAIVFDDEDNGGSTTSITEVKPNSKDGNASFYTLQGVKVSRPVKGVYIHNGKKFIK